LAFGKVQLNETALLLLVGFLLVASPAIPLLLRQSGEFGMWQDVALSTWAYLAAWYGALFAGFALSPRKLAVSRDYCTLSNSRAINWSVCFLSLIAAVGAAMVMYEFAVNRGYGFSTPIAELRVIEVMRAQSESGSWLGGVGRLLASALAVAWILTCLRWRDVSRSTIVLLLLATAVAFFQQLTFEGGRFFFTALSFAAIFASVAYAVADVFQGGRVNFFSLRLIHLQPILLIASMLFGMSIYNSAVFTSRGEATKDVIRHVIRADGEAVAVSSAGEKPEPAKRNYPGQSAGEKTGRNVTPRPTSQDRGMPALEGRKESGANLALRNKKILLEYAKDDRVPLPALTYLQYAIAFHIDVSKVDGLEEFSWEKYRNAMFWIYVTQGIGEFDRIFNLENLNHSFGFYQFPQVAQVISKFLGVDFRYDISKNLPNVGTYITLPGAYFLDFGVIFAIFLAFFTGFAFRYSLAILLERSGSVFGLIAPFLFVILAFAPVTTLFPNFWPSFVWIALLCLPSLWKRISVRQTGSA